MKKVKRTSDLAKALDGITVTCITSGALMIAISAVLWLGFSEEMELTKRFTIGAATMTIFAFVFNKIASVTESKNQERFYEQLSCEEYKKVKIWLTVLESQVLDDAEIYAKNDGYSDRVFIKIVSKNIEKTYLINREEITFI